MTARALPLPLLLLALLAAGCSAQRYQPQPERCRAPTGDEGECVQVTRCPPLLALLRASTRPQGANEFLRRSSCGSGSRDPRVCCVQGFRYEPPAEEEKTTTTTTRPMQRPMATNQQLQQAPVHPNARLLPTECGVDFAERIYGGTATDLNEYPWLALLGYRKWDGTLDFLCGGALFNNRYVLTAAHCINGRGIIRNNYRLETVRLGEYNIDTEPDCVPELTGATTCAEPAQDFRVEEALTHPGFGPNSRDQFNDIGLLRLDRNAPTTSYIRPICLPMNNVSYIGEDLVVAGWGKTESSELLHTAVRWRAGGRGLVHGRHRRPADGCGQCGRHQPPHRGRRRVLRPPAVRKGGLARRLHTRLRLHALDTRLHTALGASAVNQVSHNSPAL